MTDAVLITRKLAAMLDHVERTRRRRPPRPELLAGDLDRLDALSLSLLVAVQEAIDIAFHIASDERWGVPTSYAEGFELLERNGLLDHDLAAAMIAATGLRNRIAHGYATVDAARLWAELPNGLDALDRYARAVAAWLGD